MLDEYRIEPLSVGQYLDGVKSEDIKIDQAVQRSFCWGSEMMNALIYSALSRRIYIPNLILAEEKRKDGTKQTYVVDGGQRTETLYQFKFGGYKITNKLRSYIITYKKNKTDENGEYIRDERGNIQYEIEEFDIRGKRYEDLPQELKNKFNGCPLTTVIYQDCVTEETSELVLLYNNHVAMNAAQKAFTYIGKYADEIKRIKDTNRFLMDCTMLSENEKEKGIWERVISECVMSINHYDNWKRTPKDMCDYLNENSSEQEYRDIESYFNRLIPYCDKMDNSEIAALFTSKNLFIWMMVFDRFTDMHLSDDRFGEFLNAFVSGVNLKEVNGENWDKIDSERNTKDKSLINRKVDYITNLMEEFLHIATEENKVDDNEITTENESFIADVLNMDLENVIDKMDIYNEDLDSLTGKTIREGSKLLDVANRKSLLAMLVYAYERDVNLEQWLEHYASKNNMYFPDQRKNFLHMKKDFVNYIETKEIESV
jgi:hypothetical protein